MNTSSAPLRLAEQLRLSSSKDCGLSATLRSRFCSPALSLFATHQPLSVPVYPTMFVGAVAVELLHASALDLMTAAIVVSAQVALVAFAACLIRRRCCTRRGF